MAGKDRDIAPPPEVISYYAGFAEETRLGSGPSRLEFERTREILARALPNPPARVVDVGGAAGDYSLWLAERGYEVHLVDASPRLVEEARFRSAKSTTPLASLSVGDARRLPQESGSAAAVLVMGPLYHLPSADDRMEALGEALRILERGGVISTTASIATIRETPTTSRRPTSIDRRISAPSWKGPGSGTSTSWASKAPLGYFLISTPDGKIRSYGRTCSTWLERWNPSRPSSRSALTFWASAGRRDVPAPPRGQTRSQASAGIQWGSLPSHLTLQPMGFVMGTRIRFPAR